ncbi:DUF4251 domain-containing protein [Flammeovirga kamogawensis]|uniref:DUF4251 domain-containing protein n=1 Tax=Flammeovirga kamogawensis TaxID=373891 RepID=A0ABX8GTY9_9BACT|nr:DUF4251 domain-containing protein [Flammeovirga kamogawensis]MBB6459964.1 hypothetical protein [Flammeovirga kamogawensis]QWG06986.1 DUF4251 domain-containing protein [Flammeovirga kamogawensis]TRX68806.1 DUF4251 domain-containing protein [Flammeovirga kamogawensis]
MKHILKYLFAFIILFSSVNLFAQDTVKTKELTKSELRIQRKQQRLKEKQQRKLLTQQLEKMNHESAVVGIDSQLFVLEATQAYDRYGNVENVNSTINFVKIVDDRAIFQLGFEGIVGYNGVGGITMEGKISDYKVEKLENGRVTVKFNAMGPAMMVSMSFSLDGEGNYANVKVKSQTENIELNFRGVIKHMNQSRIYEGMKVF